MLRRRFCVSVFSFLGFAIALASCSSDQKPLGFELRLASTVHLAQDEEILYRSSGLGVTEDGYFIIADRRGSNIKVYNADGRLAKIWGRRGVGPDEFLGPCYVNYDSPHVVFLDIGQERIYIYETNKNLEFNKVREFRPYSGPSDLCLRDGWVWIPEYVRDRTQKEYTTYAIEVRSGKIQYVLPDSVFKSLYSDKEWPVIGGNFYCLPAEASVFFVWEGNLRIMRWDLRDQKAQFFGKVTNNYIKPYVNRSFRESYSGPKRSYENYMTNKRKMCYVSGLFGGDEFIALVYHRYAAELGHWTTYIQFYSPEGEFINEILVPKAITYDDMIERFFYYSRGKRLFYFLSRSLDENFQDQFTILTYSLSRSAK